MQTGAENAAREGGCDDACSNPQRQDQPVSACGKEDSNFQQVLYCSCAAVSRTNPFAGHFCRETGVSLDEAAQQASASNRTLVVLDGAHTTYDTAPYLWSTAKDILSAPGQPQHLMIFTASSHGSKPLAGMGYTACPVEFAADRSIVFR